MKIAILHHDLEDSEKKMQELLVEGGILVKMLDVREASIEDFYDVSFVLNRVYASVANRDYSSISKTLALLKALEEKNIKCLNSYLTTFYDYSKYDSYKLFKENNIATPETLFIDSEENILEIANEAIEKFGLPLVVKRNTGGRGKDISRVDASEDLIEDLKKKFKTAEEEKYGGGFIIQELIKSAKSHDMRIGVFNGKFTFSFGRTLIPGDSETNWLASMSNGSEAVQCDASDSQKELAENVTNLIGARFNEVDILFSEEGPIIIENNPTPNYTTSEKGVKRIKTFVECLKNEEVWSN